MSLCLLLVVLTGTAAATAPLPPFERSLALDGQMAYIVSGLDQKHPTIPERCIRDLFCVGPYDPDFDYHWGKTGVILTWERSNTTVGHNTTRHHEYGPYAVTTLVGDDARVCWTKCTFPAGLYGWTYGNLTVEVWVADHLVKLPRLSWDEDVPYVFSAVPSSHCQYSRTRC